VVTALEQNGRTIYDRSEVNEIADDPLTVRVGGTRVRCNHVIVATHVPIVGKANLASAVLFQSKLFPYSSYAIGARLPKGTLAEALYWDTSDPYYYLRVDRHPKHDYLVFGGADHKTGQVDNTETCYAQLESTLRTHFPEAEMVDRWSGQVIETNDGLPYIGEIANRQFVATGFSGNGITFGTLSAMMACDAVLGRDNPWKALFAVTRTNLRRGAWSVIAENAAYPYYLLGDWFFGGAKVDSVDEVQPGSGHVVKINGEHVACSRDKQGKLFSVSASCTHMGCLVHWNRAEATWDCPCHGSRFAPDGKVMGGPAETPLKAVQLKIKGV
jgi:nitrite reductase/ring-hydroxylating ferredoxin subunit